MPSDATFAYFACVDGTVVTAPDTRMSPQQCGLDPKRWRRCEAIGAREIEKISLVISRQAWEKRKQRNVQQKLREFEFLQQREISARLRRAVNFSPRDIEANKLLERKWKDKQGELEALIVSEFKPENRNTALDVELKEQPILPHHLGQKKQGVST